MVSFAVIGAGLSGLTCAGDLTAAGHRVVVFDKGRRVGGRLATRRHERWQFDHGAQYLTARDESFRSTVAAWEAAGVVEPWGFRQLDLTTGEVSSKERWVGAPSMRRIAEFLAASLDVRLESQVAPFAPEDGTVALSTAGGRGLGRFDCVVVTAPTAQADRLLAGVPGTPAASAVHAPCWAALLGYDEPVPTEAQAYRNGTVLGWAANDSSKPQRPTAEAWVLHATPQWSTEHLELSAEDAAERMVQAWLELNPRSGPPRFVHGHRWRYAQVVDARGPAARPLADGRIIVAGDGCAGARLEAAFLSGQAAAREALRAHG